MSSFKDRSDYFKLICARNKLIAHNKTIEGTSDKRKSFFRINDEEELNAACVNWIHFPCVVHTGHNIFFKQPDTGLPRMNIGNHLQFLAKLDTDTYPEAADAIEAAYDSTFTALCKFVSYMINDKAVNGVCGEMFLFNLNRAKAEQIGPINQVLYGWYLQFQDEEKAKEMKYVEDDWDMEADGGDGDGGGGEYDLQNFTDVEITQDEHGIKFQFSGGNLIGNTQFAIEEFGDNYNSISEGQTVASAGISFGNHTIKWRRQKGSQFSAWSEEVSFEYVDTGGFLFEIRLIDVPSDNENNVQFPVNVAQIVTHNGGLDTKTNSNQVANDQNEFITIWNSINSAHSILTSAEYKNYSPSFKSWEFKGTSVQYAQRPSAAWCYTI